MFVWLNDDDDDVSRLELVGGRWCRIIWISMAEIVLILIFCCCIFSSMWLFQVVSGVETADTEFWDLKRKLHNPSPHFPPTGGA